MHKHFNKKGYSLVEVMVSVAIAMLALGILGRAFVSQRKAYEEQTQVVEMQQQAKIAMHIITTELQMAGYLPEASGNQPTTNDIQDLTATTMNSLTFQGDIDGDNVSEKITYTVAVVDATTHEGRLTREVSEWDPDPTDETPDDDPYSAPHWNDSAGAQSLVDYVYVLDEDNFNAANDFTVTYYDSNGNPTAVAASVRKIKIELTVSNKKTFSTSDTSDDRSQTLSVEITARNLGL